MTTVMVDGNEPGDERRSLVCSPASWLRTPKIWWIGFWSQSGLSLEVLMSPSAAVLVAFSYEALIRVQFEHG